jgi:multidrug efflux pump subunit AcrB
VVSITAALVSALIPILFMPDIVGRYFCEFGLTLVSAIGLSAIISLTLTPMMCRHLLERSRPAPVRRSRMWAERATARLVAAYGQSLDWSLRHRTAMAIVTAAVAVSSAGLYLALPKGFMPTQDTGLIFVRTFTNASASFAAMEDLQRTIAATIRADVAVDNTVSYISGGNGGVSSWGYMMINLKPLSERRQSVQQVIEGLREKVRPFHDVETYFTPVQDLNIGARQTSPRYHYAVSSTDPAQAMRWGNVMRQRIRSLPQVRDVITDTDSFSGLEAGVVIDRQRAAYHGVTPVAIDNTLYDAFGQRWVKTVFLPLNYSEVILEADRRLQADPSLLDQVFVSNVGGRPVPLASLMQPSRVHMPMWLHHDDRFPAMTIHFDTAPGVGIEEAIAAIRETEMAAKLPDEVKTYFRGEAAEASKSPQKEAFLLFAAILAVYVVLGVLYESYAHPFTILSILPSTTFGALLALYLTGSQFTLMTSIACILLVGMVMKNSIMMVDFALDAERGRGLSAEGSIREAALIRFRPILMTTLAAILSALPLAIGTGPGHELRQPLGVAIVGGLLVSQLLTLYTTPAVYLLVDSLRPKSGQRGLRTSPRDNR